VFWHRDSGACRCLGNPGVLAACLLRRVWRIRGVGCRSDLLWGVQDDDSSRERDSRVPFEITVARRPNPFDGGSGVIVAGCALADHCAVRGRSRRRGPARAHGADDGLHCCFTCAGQFSETVRDRDGAGCGSLVRVQSPIVFVPLARLVSVYRRGERAADVVLPYRSDSIFQPVVSHRQRHMAVFHVVTMRTGRPRARLARCVAITDRDQS